MNDFSNAENGKIRGYYFCNGIWHPGEIFWYFTNQLTYICKYMLAKISQLQCLIFQKIFFYNKWDKLRFDIVDIQQQISLMLMQSLNLFS